MKPQHSSYLLKNSIEFSHQKLVNSKNFNLVELLVVISVFTVLISLLQPSLVNIKQNAQKIECMGKMRTIHTGLLLYDNDHQSLPYFYAPSPHHHRFYTSLVTAGYFERVEITNLGRHNKTGKQPSLFLCPTDYEKDRDKLFYYGGYMGSYGTVSRFFGVIANGYKYIREPKSIHQIQKPQQSQLVGECSTDETNGSSHINIWDKNSYLAQPNRFKHNLSTHLLIADGHIKEEHINSDFSDIVYSNE